MCDSVNLVKVHSQVWVNPSLVAGVVVEWDSGEQAECMNVLVMKRKLKPIYLGLSAEDNQDHEDAAELASTDDVVAWLDGTYVWPETARTATPQDAPDEEVTTQDMIAEQQVLAVLRAGFTAVDVNSMRLAALTLFGDDTVPRRDMIGAISRLHEHDIIHPLGRQGWKIT